MLAQTATDVSEALDRLGAAAFEYKLDGARIQVHKRGDDIQVFSRLLNDVTVAVPEVIDSVRRLALKEAILDGEAIALSAEGQPLPFQATMRRFGRKLDVQGLQGELPLTSFFFDVLYVDGASLLAEPYTVRYDTLARFIPESWRIPRIVSGEVDEAQQFFDAAIARGHEGLMAKSLQAAYKRGDAAGRG
jgi:DNA ligase-1